jgi:hypothetical protein
VINVVYAVIIVESVAAGNTGRRGADAAEATEGGDRM